jgi:predicted class III extradiol MEMO1 family dioxygenase
MDIIESGNPDAFQEYLKEFENTICGRHPIGVFLNVISLPPSSSLSKT